MTRILHEVIRVRTDVVGSAGTLHHNFTLALAIIASATSPHTSVVDPAKLGVVKFAFARRGAGLVESSQDGVV